MATRVGVVGLGLMGGSLLRLMAAAETRAIGWDSDAETRERASAAGLALADSLEALASVSDVVFLAVPLTELGSVLTALPGRLDPAAVVSDLTSVKQPAQDLAGGLGFRFVGGHPMAGTEESGFSASTPELLAGAAWVLTVDEQTDIDAWLTVAGVITGLGCRVVPCTSADHDRAVARISHLPHVVAAAVALAAADDPLALSLAAGSFRDATRVAATRPDLLAAMCGGNAAAVEAELGEFAAQLAKAGRLLGDPQRLLAWFAGAGDVRRGWPPAVDVAAQIAVDEQLPGRLLDLGRAGGHVVAVTGEHVVVARPA